MILFPIKHLAQQARMQSCTQNFGPAALKQLEGAQCHGSSPSSGSDALLDLSAMVTAQTAPSQHRSQVPLPLLGVLKLTPEKGCSVVLALAQHLEGLFNFLVVAGGYNTDKRRQHQLHTLPIT